jgi:4'-phosphopantetheinyl transferase
MPSIHCKSIIRPIDWGIPDKESFQLKGEVAVWRIPISMQLPPATIKSFFPEEQEWAIANRFFHEKDRQRFILGKIARKFLLGKYLKLDPLKLRFRSGQNKKPELEPELGKELHFNLSHSGEWLLLAIGEKALGVDIEAINVKFNYRELLDTCFNKVEIEFIERSPDPLLVFFNFWTRKEALIKALGKGLDQDLPAIPCLDGTHPIGENIPDIIQNWIIYGFEPAPQHAASLAISPHFTALDLNRIVIEFFELSEISFQGFVGTYS